MLANRQATIDNEYKNAEDEKKALEDITEDIMNHIIELTK